MSPDWPRTCLAVGLTMLITAVIVLSAIALGQSAAEHFVTPLTPGPSPLRAPVWMVSR